MSSSAANRSRRGIALLPAIFLMVMLGIMLGGVTWMLVGSIKAQKHYSLLEDHDIIARIIAEALSCKATIDSHGSSQPPHRVALRKANREELVPANGGFIGEWFVRATCMGEGNGIFIQMARPLTANALTTDDPREFVSDPLTKQPLNFYHPRAYILPPRTTSEPPITHQTVSTIFLKKGEHGQNITVPAYKDEKGDLQPYNIKWCLERSKAGSVAPPNGSVPVNFIPKVAFCGFNANPPAGDQVVTCGIDQVDVSASLRSPLSAGHPATQQRTVDFKPNLVWPMSYLILGE